jgi:hypothetical protein
MTDLLTGPLAYIPGISFEDVNGNNIYDPGIDVPIDTAYSFRGPLGVPIYPGAKNLILTSSVYYFGGDANLGDPPSKTAARNNQMGLTRSGNTIDPCNWSYGYVFGGVPCGDVNPFFWSSGDPVLNIGWISIIEGDERNIQTSGPFELVKDKEIEILAAFEVGQGDSALGSITTAKNISDETQEFYEDNFGYPYVLNIRDKNSMKINYSLSQNFPNPFNPSTKIKYSVPHLSEVQIKVYDILGNEIETLVYGEKPAGIYEVTWNSVNLPDGKAGLPSGVYFYQLKATPVGGQAGSFIETMKMVLLK